MVQNTCNDQFDQKVSNIGPVWQCCFPVADMKSILGRKFPVTFGFLLLNFQILIQQVQISHSTRTETIVFFQHHSA